MATKVRSGSAAAIVAALLLPPLGVFLHQGITPSFWAAVALTILGFIPGMAFALFTVLKRRPTLAF
ncbi:MAG: hypothetical protein JWM38_1595 [Sphingomonas bacterium]|nr:hypothetical protein [Sphingomonas bacterium]